MHICNPLNGPGCAAYAGTLAVLPAALNAVIAVLGAVDETEAAVEAGEFLCKSS